MRCRRPFPRGSTTPVCASDTVAPHDYPFWDYRDFILGNRFPKQIWIHRFEKVPTEKSWTPFSIVFDTDKIRLEYTRLPWFDSPVHTVIESDHRHRISTRSVKRCIAPALRSGIPPSYISNVTSPTTVARFTINDVDTESFLSLTRLDLGLFDRPLSTRTNRPACVWHGRRVTAVTD